MGSTAIATEQRKLGRSPRIERLRQEYFSIKPSLCIERARIITRVYRETEALPIVLRRARAFEAILAEMSIYIRPGELIVGNHASKPLAAPIFPEYATRYLEEEIDAFATRPGEAFEVSADAKAELLENLVYWRDKTVQDRQSATTPEETRLASEEYVGAVYGLLYAEGGDGHIAPGHPMVVREGLNGLIARAQAKLANLDVADPENMARRIFLEATIVANKAVIAFAARFAALAREQSAHEADPVRKAELLEIAAICDRVPAEPARTFHEALQAVWFVQVAVQLETNGHSISIGRFDQYMYPFYQADVQAGRLTRERALELTQAFWLKLSEISKHRSGTDTRNGGGGPLFQNLTIGGQNQDGLDATNELSFICLDATESMKTVQPSLTVRIHKNTPDEFLLACLHVVSTGGGMPAFFNDEIIIESLLARGVTEEDAYDYCLVGCVEQSVQGKWGGRHGGNLFNIAKMMELALFDGRDPRTGIQLLKGKGDLSTFTSFDQLMTAYKEQVEFFARQMVIMGNVQDQSWLDLAPTPFLSSLVSECIERGRDLKDGGAIYDYSGSVTLAVATVANSLAAVKKLVFDEKVIGGGELQHALETDFAGPEGERIRQLLVHRAPKFGNDDDTVDLIAKEAFGAYMHCADKYKNTRWGKGPIGCTFQPSSASVSGFMMLGDWVGATPDGRKAYTPLSDVESPYHGTDLNGPTAALRSVSKMDHIHMSGGSLLNLRLHPSAFGK